MHADGRRHTEQFDMEHTDRFIKGIRIDWDSELYYERYGGRSLHEQSHGESFLSLMQNTFEEILEE